MANKIQADLSVSRKMLLTTVMMAATMATCGLYGQAALPDPLKVFRPAGPMPSYEVATIKPPDKSGSDFERGFTAGFVAAGGAKVRRYIQNAYGIPSASVARVVGGPAWLDDDTYIIKGKAPDEVRDAMAKMTPADRLNEDRQMQQMLLQERFKLKVHFATREMPVYELVPAKNGLKIKAVAPPPAGEVPRRRAGEPLPPGSFGVGPGKIVAAATTMPTLINWLTAFGADLDGRPIVDKTGFTGNFDVEEMTWMPSRATPGFESSPSPDAVGRSLFTALEQTLGMKLVPGKAQVEVVVIDSIDRPSEN